MKSIYVTSWSGYSGKTAFCLGLAQVLKKEGVKVGYFRPIGRPTLSDEGMLIDQDVVLMKKVLDLPFKISELVPVLIEPNYHTLFMKHNLDELKDKILSNFKRVSENYEFMIIEGSLAPELMTAFNLNNLDLAKMLRSKVLMVTGGFNDNTIDQILFYKSIVENENVNFYGVVFNQVPNESYDVIKKVHTEFLKEKKVKVWGVIPLRFEIVSPTVRDFKELLEGKILVEGDLTRSVRKILIGAMQTDAALRFLRRTEDNAVITGGDRPNIISAAIETGASVIILTGNLRPSDQVLTKAEEKNVTVILVPYDSYTTVKLLEKLTGKIHPSDVNRIKLTEDMVRNNIDWEDFYDSL